MQNFAKNVWPIFIVVNACMCPDADVSIYICFLKKITMFLQTKTPNATKTQFSISGSVLLGFMSRFCTREHRC